jgi:biotin synthase-related radical SAM superfamily protein
VNLFSKRGSVSEIAAPSDQDRYAEILKQLRVTEVELSASGLAIAKYNATHKDMRTSVVNGETFYRVGAMFADPVLQKLESDRNRILERRNNILREYAQLKRRLGLTR